MAQDVIIWVAGPIGYESSEVFLAGGQREISRCKWEFVGGASSGALRRWVLIFNVDTRAFTVSARTTTRWEQSHAAPVAALYRPIAVLRRDLPKGGLAKALKSMLREADIAEVTAISMRGGVP